MQIYPQRAPDVVVIGGGIIGLSSAWSMARAGHRVCVLDRGEFGRAASWAGGGILSELPPGEVPAGLESLLAESLAAYPDFCAQLFSDTGIDPEYWRCGAQVWRGARSSWQPQIAQVRNPRLLRALIAALQGLNADLRPHTPVLALEQAGGRVRGVRTVQGLIACERVVLAAGAWSGDVAGAPLTPVKGEMLMLQAPAAALTHLLIDEDSYLIPRRDGQVLVGSTLVEAGFDTTPTAAARAWLQDRARRLCPSSARWPVSAHWAGLRPLQPGGLPRLAADQHCQGLFHNTGHYRLGITLAPASAQRALDWLAG